MSIPDTDASAPSTPASDRDARGRFVPGNPHRWPPGQTGNREGKVRGASFAHALARQAVASVNDREEMAKIAQTIGLDPADAKNIDVVAALFYTVLCRLMVRATSTNARVDERLVGMLQVLLRALDPTELRVSGPGGGPIPIAAAVASVQVALGMAPVTLALDEPANATFDQLPIARDDAPVGAAQTVALPADPQA